MVGSCWMYGSNLLEVAHFGLRCRWILDSVSAVFVRLFYIVVSIHQCFLEARNHRKGHARAPQKPQNNFARTSTSPTIPHNASASSQNPAQQCHKPLREFPQVPRTNIKPPTNVFFLIVCHTPNGLQINVQRHHVLQMALGTAVFISCALAASDTPHDNPSLSCCISYAPSTWHTKCEPRKLRDLIPQNDVAVPSSWGHATSWRSWKLSTRSLREAVFSSSGGVGEAGSAQSHPGSVSAAVFGKHITHAVRPGEFLVLVPYTLQCISDMDALCSWVWRTQSATHSA